MLATVSGALVRQTCAKKRFRCLRVASCSPSGGWSAVELRKARRAAKFSLELILRRKWGFPARYAIRPDCGIGFARRQASGQLTSGAAFTQVGAPGVYAPAGI